MVQFARLRGNQTNRASRNEGPRFHRRGTRSITAIFDPDTMQQRVDASPFGLWWGLLVESVSSGASRIRLPYRQSLERLGGVLHGGCTVVVADVAVWVAIM